MEDKKVENVMLGKREEDIQNKQNERLINTNPTSTGGGYYGNMNAYSNGGNSTNTTSTNASIGAQNMRYQGTCPVCFSQALPTNIILEPCQHQFHANCIDRWLQNEKTCPACRVPIQRHQTIVRNYSTPQYPPQHMQMHMTHHPQYSPHPSHAQMHGMPMHGMHVNMAMNYPMGHFPSASVYELPPEIFLDNPYDPNSAINASKMRKGKWTTEEAAYCDRLIEEFKHGNLPLAEGTTLRTFLSKLLNCDPMRISKKYTGTQCIGKVSRECM